MPEPRVCLGVITAAHGIKGEVRIKSFTAEPAGIAAYGPLEDGAGARRGPARELMRRAAASYSSIFSTSVAGAATTNAMTIGSQSIVEKHR